uniref:Uncharacterized protein n=1 Tax=Oryza sativa subsp. japonica TaxID=39947 RepID=Q69L91_ORYSJ|nr:hypothetical protein [Oryza sativa Japonica Group]
MATAARGDGGAWRQRRLDDSGGAMTVGIGTLRPQLHTAAVEARDPAGGNRPRTDPAAVAALSPCGIRSPSFPPQIRWRGGASTVVRPEGRTDPAGGVEAAAADDDKEEFFVFSCGRCRPHTKISIFPDH